MSASEGSSSVIQPGAIWVRSRAEAPASPCSSALERSRKVSRADAIRPSSPGTRYRPGNAFERIAEGDRAEDDTGRVEDELRILTGRPVMSRREDRRAGRSTQIITGNHGADIAMVQHGLTHTVGCASVAAGAVEHQPDPGYPGEPPEKPRLPARSDASARRR